MASTLRVGFGQAEVTPPLGTRLHGYPKPDRVAESVLDPLFARVLVFDDGSCQAALVSLDWCMVEDEDVASIRSVVGAATGVPPAQITVAAIQTHTGPATQSCWGWGDKDRDYLAGALPKIGAAAQQAAEALVPVRLGIGTALSEVGVNRREIREDHSVALGTNPWGPYDPAMTVLRFESDQGTVASLVHYGAHPTSLGHLPVISRDWPGVMLDRLEAQTGAPALYVNGAVGDVGPRLSSGRTTGMCVEAMLEVGYRAAADAIGAWQSIKDFRAVDLGVLTESILLPYAPLADLAEAERQVAAWAPRRDEWGAPMCEYHHWRTVVEAHGRPPEAGKPYLQTITRLGPVALVPMPGEPFAEIVLRLRRYSPFPHTLTLSTTNGCNGYFVTRESRHRGGYEVWVAKAFGPYLLAENTDDVLVESNLRLLRALASS